MRIGDLEKLLAIKKVVTLRMSITAGAIVGIPVFLLGLAGGFFGALLMLVLFGGGLFGLVFLLRTMVDRGVEKKRAKLEALQGDFIDVTLNREFGVLEFFDNMVVFHNLTPGGTEKKRLEFQLTDQAFIGSGLITNRLFEKYAYKDISRGFVLVRENSHSLPSQFVFINIGNEIEQVTQIVQSINKYQE